MASGRCHRRRNLSENKAKQLLLAKQYCQSYGDQEGFEVKFIDDLIGEGVFTTKTFWKGDFLLQYSGDLITNYQKAKQLDKEYEEAELGCFMYFFKCKGKAMCIDSTQDIFRQGRMVNDAPKGDALENCEPKVVYVDDVPNICFFATRDIDEGEELRFDYGDCNLPWRKKPMKKLNDEKESQHLSSTENKNTHTASHMGEVDQSNDDEVNEVNAKPSDHYEEESQYINSTVERNVCVASHTDEVGKRNGDKTNALNVKPLDNDEDDSQHINSTVERNVCVTSHTDEVGQRNGDKTNALNVKQLDNDEDDSQHINSTVERNVCVTSHTDEVGQRNGDKTNALNVKPLDNDEDDSQHINSTVERNVCVTSHTDEVGQRNGDKTNALNVKPLDNDEDDSQHINSTVERNVCVTSHTDEVGQRNGDKTNALNVKPLDNDEDDSQHINSTVQRNVCVTSHTDEVGQRNGDKTNALNVKPLDNDEDDSQHINSTVQRNVCVTSHTDEVGQRNGDKTNALNVKPLDNDEEDSQHITSTVERNLCVTSHTDTVGQSNGDETNELNVKPLDNDTSEVHDDESVDPDFEPTDHDTSEVHDDESVDPDFEPTDHDVYSDEDSEDYGENCRTNSQEFELDDNIEEEASNRRRDTKISSTLKHHMRNVTIPTYSRKDDGSRSYQKTNVCLFCERSFTSKISSHYLNIHINKEEVKKIRLMAEHSKERKVALMQLENRGNFQHNVKVIERGSGEIIVARRPSATHKGKYCAADFLPCEFCMAFYLKESLWQHVRSCPLKPEGKQPSENYVRHAHTILSPFIGELEEDEANVDILMTGLKETSANPGIPKLCESDPLIREFAKSMLGRLGEESEQRVKDMDNVRTKVRTVGRLLKELNEESDNALPLTHFFTGRTFEKVVKATKHLALASDSPQLALVLGHYIKHLAFLKISLGIMSGSTEDQNDGRDFQFLYQAHWNNKVSCIAKRRQKLRQLNKPSKIPATCDLVTLRNWLQVEIEKHQRNTSPNWSEWKWLAQLVMVRILLFNKRRVSEVIEMKTSDFLAMKEQPIDEEILKSFDVSERTLSKRLSVMEIRGKSTRGIRKVYVILTPDMQKALQYLISKRKLQSIFIFSRQNGLTPLDGCEAMRLVTETCPGLKDASLIRTRLLRKYLATTSQLLDMNSAELKMLADHMGHNLNIHTDVYRLQTCILEKTKVARVLMAVDNGKINRFQGRSLESINIDDLPTPISYDDSWSGMPENTDDGEEEMHDASNAEDNLSNGAGNDQEIVESESRGNKRLYPENDTRDVTPGLPPEKIQRIRWTDEENRIFKSKMLHYIQAKQMPPGDILKELSKHLNNRTVPQLRTKVHNIITGKLKKF